MFNFLSCKRRRYYSRCQEIIVYIHDNVAGRGFVSDAELVAKFGEANYRAFLHELHLMGIGDDIDKRTPAMEWLYASFVISVIAFVISFASVLVSVFK